MNRRLQARARTITWGAIPVLAMTFLASCPTVPFTSIPLTVPYAAEGPGPTYNTLADYEGKKIVSISGEEEDKTTGNLNMTTVVVRTQLTLTQALTRWLLHDDTLVPIEQIFPPNMSQDEVQQHNQTEFTQSESAATLAAMSYLHRPTMVEIIGVLDDAAAHGIVRPGQRIVAVDSAPISAPGQVRELVQNKKPGDSIVLDLVDAHGAKESKTVTLGEHPETKKALLGITMGAVPADNLKVEYNLEDIGGPSAGLMFTLAVIDKLSPGELTGGKFIAGTGTIAEDGTVGPIGGIQHKVAAAAEAGAEVFLSPAANCKEAMLKQHDGLTVIKVNNLADAVTQLENYQAGREVTTCQK
ncbi:PDZ domain-containing protein [Staphylococcus chromogenes]|nr:PDZ domain-containing protein [Staphylococcus chromogenes]